MNVRWLAEPVARLKRRPRLLGLVAAAVVVAGGASLVAEQRGVSQPIAFNHRKHTQDLQLDCEFCHQYVRTGAHSGLPSLEVCAICHQARQGTSREAERVTAFVEEGRPLVFAKLFQLPAHVFYTHRRHVGIAQLECRNCHGDIALTSRPPKRPLVRVRMRVCMNCHRRTGQTTDCVACHR